MKTKLMSLHEHIPFMTHNPLGHLTIIGMYTVHDVNFYLVLKRTGKATIRC